MAASGSWFRRLWSDDENSSVGTATLPEHEADAETSADQLQENAMPNHGPAYLETDVAAEAPGTAPHPLDGHREDANGFDASLETPRGTVNGSAGEMSSNPEASQEISAPASPRARPPRPLTYHQLMEASVTARNGHGQAQGPVAAENAPAQGSPRERRDSGSNLPVATSGPAGPSNSSASRRAANPFDRPSLYRPPSMTNDQSFEDAFTSDPARPASSSGRWDPIPPLRPSSWRDSGSFRAAGAPAKQDERWNWTPEAKPETPQGWTSQDSPAPEEAEPTLTRQWGLLSRFQQARGLGLPPRRANQADDASGSHDAVPPGSPQDRRKG